MDRRTFLKTLVALGASLPLPLDLLASSEAGREANTIAKENGCSIRFVGEGAA